MLRSRVMATKKGNRTGVSPKEPKRGRTAEPPKKKVGRPRGKHSDPNYVQMLVYVHKGVRTKVRMRLLEAGGELSGLVESLLREWLKMS